ncbi:MAG: LysM peptidoglycan-binding domain-containing protein [Planctomycetota bacterium]|jgi:hypothetical protein
MSFPYTVKYGDTLTLIAKRHGLSSWRDVYYYGENESFRAKRPNPDKIYPGDVVMIPGDGGPGTPSDEFKGFNETQRFIILSDLDLARRMLNLVIGRLNTLPGFILDTQQKLFNVFDIDLSAETAENPPAIAHERMKLFFLRGNFARLRKGLDERFPKEFDPKDSPMQNAAYVIGTGRAARTVYFTPRYFAIPMQPDRAVTIVHERAHTLCQPPNDTAHPGTGDSPACVVPHEDKAEARTFASRPFYDQAIRNPWCYEWLTLSLQPTYNPQRFRNRPGCRPVIVRPPQ